MQLKTHLNYEENFDSFQLRFFLKNFRALCSAVNFFFLHHHVSHVLPERGREARVHAQGMETLCVTSLSLRACRSFVARFCRLFFSPLEHRTTLISIEQFISRNSPPPPSFFSLYVLQKTGPDGKPTLSAHPARFSPDDKFSKQRVACKKRFGLLLTQQPEKQF